MAPSTALHSAARRPSLSRMSHVRHMRGVSCRRHMRHMSPMRHVEVPAQMAHPAEQRKPAQKKARNKAHKIECLPVHLFSRFLAGVLKPARRLAFGAAPVRVVAPASRPAVARASSPALVRIRPHHLDVETV